MGRAFFASYWVYWIVFETKATEVYVFFAIFVNQQNSYQ